MNIDGYTPTIIDNNLHFIAPKKNYNLMLVVRGHQTSDILGVDSVVDRHTIDAIAPLINMHYPAKIYLEDAAITKQNAKDHNKHYRNVIYVGGTSLMWYRIRSVLTHKLEYSPYKETFSIRKPFRHDITLTDNNFIIYEKLYKDGSHIVCLYSASAIGTALAVKQYQVLFDLTEPRTRIRVYRFDETKTEIFFGCEF